MDITDNNILNSLDEEDIDLLDYYLEITEAEEIDNASE